MRLDVEPIVFERAMADIAAYWERGPHHLWEGKPFLPLAGSAEDQLVPDGVDNPYWELLRHMPWVDDLPWRGRTVYGFVDQVGISRGEFATTYSWSIPSPGDIAWIAGLLDGRGVVEVGAGTGYWAWQLAQAGVDVVAYEPNEPGDNKFVSKAEPYVPLLRDDASAAGRHPDRALLLSWPNYDEPWAAQALATYRGDLLIYVGESDGGCCADDQFFELRRDWTEIGDSPHHRTWYGINCYLTAFGRDALGGAS